MSFFQENWPDIAKGVGVLIAFIFGYFKGRQREKIKKDLMLKDIELSGKDAIIREKERFAEYEERVNTFYSKLRTNSLKYTD